MWGQPHLLIQPHEDGIIKPEKLSQLQKPSPKKNQQMGETQQIIPENESAILNFSIHFLQFHDFFEILERKF